MKTRYFACAAMFLLISLVLGCGGGGSGSSSGTTTDTTTPTVSISTPANNSSASGTIAITASASDNVGVSKVEFYVNGSLQTTVTASPYTFSWDTSPLSSGTYSLTAKAYDAANNSTTSSAVSVAVNGSKTGPTTATLTLSIPSLPANTLVGGVAFNITLPAGVSPTVLSGTDASGSVTFTGGGSGISVADYTAPQISFGRVTLSGFGTGNFMTVNCTVSSGTTVTPSGFSLSGIQVFDTNGTQISATINMSVLLL
jgi:chitinase